LFVDSIIFTGVLDLDNSGRPEFTDILNLDGPSAKTGHTESWCGGEILLLEFLILLEGRLGIVFSRSLGQDEDDLAFNI
jgi:hypothetical protein